MGRNALLITVFVVVGGSVVLALPWIRDMWTGPVVLPQTEARNPPPNSIAIDGSMKANGSDATSFNGSPGNYKGGSGGGAGGSIYLETSNQVSLANIQATGGGGSDGYINSSGSYGLSTPTTQKGGDGSAGQIKNEMVFSPGSPLKLSTNTGTISSDGVLTLLDTQHADIPATTRTLHHVHPPRHGNGSELDAGESVTLTLFFPGDGNGDTNEHQSTSDHDTLLNHSTSLGSNHQNLVSVFLDDDSPTGGCTRHHRCGTERWGHELHT